MKKKQNQSRTWKLERRCGNRTAENSNNFNTEQSRAEKGIKL